ncbi:GNAT family N-acetyltransferase [Edaphovirga cremea]|uniref:GNAT family N-acetyltransferase n=1 Tax=Edaphovirga cremea TaxID=2267246 RepID=UPI0039890178
MGDITIRHVQAEDYQQLHQLYAHQEVYSDTLHLPFTSSEQWVKRSSEQPVGFYNLVALTDGKIVGQLGLEANQRPRRRHVATFGLGVHPDYQGQGVGSRLMAAMIDMCDNWLNIQRIELTVFKDNAAAIALYRKFGFQHEGTSPHFALRNGAFIDAYHMGRIKLIGAAG